MPALKTYDLFISHAWSYGDEYTRLANMLDQAAYFYYRNYSAPEHKPLFDPTHKVPNREVLAAIDRKIRPVNCVLIISGMYAARREWIQAEIDIATAYNKPIIGVIPRGQERLPKAVTDVAWDTVGWSTSSIVSAIRKYSI